MKLLLILLAFIFGIKPLYGQNNLSIKGNTADTMLKKPLANVTICILNAKDSTLVQFVYSNEDGLFNISNLSVGDYILLLSYPGYADYVERFILENKTPTSDFRKIIMKSKTVVLQEVVVKSKIKAMEMKGDTVQFNAKAYVIQPNDKVEDLLRQLPGIQVDRNGKITAQGQTVAKVLVDGEEFFGDDPTLVTKNIRSDMVDKIQLFDKKSDQAAFTGIDDGAKIKALNIKLKEDKKNGIFGKVNLGIGTDKYYEGQSIYNRFKVNKKYSAFINSSNDGKTGLSNPDNRRISFNSALIGASGLINTSNGADELDSYNGNYSGRGKPSAKNAGIHYDSKWNDNKESSNANYQIGSIEITGTNDITSQLALPSVVINTTILERFMNYAARQKIDGIYRNAIDSTSHIDIKIGGIVKTFDVNNEYFNVSKTNSNKIINRQARVITNTGDQQLFDINAFYTKKFKRPGRTFSWRIGKTYDRIQKRGFLKSKSEFFNDVGIADSLEDVNQLKTNNIQNEIVNNEIAFSEKLSKLLSLALNYRLTLDNSFADRKSFNESLPGKYTIPDSLFSSDYRFNQVSNLVGVNFAYIKGKTMLNFGANVAKATFKQSNNFTGEIYRRVFVNWQPQLYYRYGFSSQRSLSFRYFGNSMQPDIIQIQPIKTNTDPLNIVEGNPTLKSAYSNSLDLTYQVNNPLNNHAMYLGARYFFVSNNISSDIVTNPLSGKTTLRYINLTDRNPYTYSLFADITRRIGAGGISVGLTLNSKGVVGYNYINNLINKLSTYSYDCIITVGKNKKDRYDHSVSAGPNYTINRFSLQPGNDSKVIGFTSFIINKIFLPIGFQLSSEIQYTYFGKSKAFEAQNRTLWNAAVSKTFLKNNNLKLSLAGNDLFNENELISRYSAENVISQSSFSTIRRYFMLSASWDFTKFGKIAIKE